MWWINNRKWDAGFYEVRLRLAEDQQLIHVPQIGFGLFFVYLFYCFSKFKKKKKKVEHFNRKTLYLMGNTLLVIKMNLQLVSKINKVKWKVFHGK